MIREIDCLATVRQDDDPSSPFLRRGYEGTSIYQLTSVQYPSDAAFSNTGFNYDRLGNRTTMTNGAATTYAANNLNQYTTVNTDSLTYDNNGNLTGNAGWTYGYDYENRLTSATNGTTNASYGYDPFGRRISKTVNGTTTNFVYDGDNLIAEYDSNGTLLRKYIHSDNIDEPIAIVSGSDTYFYTRDDLNSTSEITDNTGSVMEKYLYDVYGATKIYDGNNQEITQSAIGNRFAFTGRELDSETGLYYYRARAYSSELGRFLQTDPIDCLDDINLYRYVGNNSTNFIDPDGLAGESIVMRVGQKALRFLGKISRDTAKRLYRKAFKKTGKYDLYTTSKKFAKKLAKSKGGKVIIEPGKGYTHAHDRLRKNIHVFFGNAKKLLIVPFLAQEGESSASDGKADLKKLPSEERNEQIDQADDSDTRFSEKITDEEVENNTATWMNWIEEGVTVY